MACLDMIVKVLVPFTVKTKNVTYKMVLVSPVNQGFMGETVATLAQATVMLIYVTKKVEPVLHVNLVGLENFVKLVYE